MQKHFNFFFFILYVFTDTSRRSDIFVGNEGGRCKDPETRRERERDRKLVYLLH